MLAGDGKGMIQERKGPWLGLKMRTSHSHTARSSKMNQLPAFQRGVSRLVLTLTRTSP